MQALRNFFRRKKKKEKQQKSDETTMTSTTVTCTDDDDAKQKTIKKRVQRTKRKRNPANPAAPTTIIANVHPTTSVTIAPTQIATVHQQASREDIKQPLAKAFIEATLKNGVKGLIGDFRGRKRNLDINGMAEFVKQNAEGRNRYKDVGCLDCTRVPITLGPIPYIHANYVSTPSNPKKFICTQAPLLKTCPEFWYMIVQEKSTVILMLCNITERGANKCAQYFPAENGGSVTFEDITVTAKSQELMQFPFDSKVKIQVTQLEVTVPGQPPHMCTHYHWQDWPDRGVPDADMAPIHLLKNINDNGAPIIVHCSAGIGRTGSMVLIQHIMELLEKEIALEASMGNYMDELRKQRNNSVQTEHQYLYVHQVMLLYMLQNGYMDREIYKEAMAKFTADYQKATSAFGA